MRRLTLLVAILGALATAASASSSPLFIVSGHGWGHGIGMSQWGAEGYATLGHETYDWILGHYYEGTELRTRSSNPFVNVTLTSGRSSLSIGSAARFKVTDADGRTFTLDLGQHRIGPSLRITTASGTKRRLASPATFEPRNAPLSSDGVRYRGVVRVTSDGSSLSAVNKLRLEQYVRGVVPREVPSDWDMEALKAQAVAARSYALAVGGLTTTTSSQVYGGLDAETGRTNQAVTATAKQVVWYAPTSEIAKTFFFSTSGGKTVSYAEEWNAPDVPYLQTETDPYDSISPHHSWGPLDAELDCPGTHRDCAYTATAMASRLGFGSIQDLKVTRRNSGNRVEKVAITTPGGIKTRTGAFFRDVGHLGLRSTWFTIGVLDITPGRTKVVYGNRVRLTLLVRNVKSVTLEQRPTPGGAWSSLPVKQKDADTYLASPKPSVGTTYRLHSPAASGAAVDVRVAARILFRDTQPAGGGALRGLVQPASLAGATVKVDRRRSGSWRRVATAAVRSNGTWRANFHVVAGVYRARIAPPKSSGLVRGVSPTLTVKLS